MKLSKIDLLALPCAGASATMYYRWRYLLPEWIRVHPVELPGRGTRLQESFIENFESLIDQICNEHSAVLQGRYALFGHSMGALLSYGIAKRQCALQKPLPLSLFVSACSSPSQHDIKRFAHRHDRTQLINDLHRQGGTPEEIFQCDEMLDLTLSVLAADYGICNSFRYECTAPLPIPIKVFAGRDDEIAPDRMEAWQKETNAIFSLDWFNGGHFFIRQHEKQMLATIKNELSKTAHRHPATV